MKSTGLYPCVGVESGQVPAVGLAGAVLLTEAIRVTGLGDGLSQALAAWRRPSAVHEPGKVLSDLAVCVALRGRCLSDLAVLRCEDEVFGPVASDPTVCRLIKALARDAERRLTTVWGEPPRWNEDGASWVGRVIRPRIDADPRVVEATAQQQAAAKAVRKALEPDDLPRLRMYARIFGTDAVAKNQAAHLDARPHRNVEDATRTANRAHAEIEALRALTPTEALRRIKQSRAIEQTQRDATDRAVEERHRQLQSSRALTQDHGPRYGGPSLDR